MLKVLPGFLQNYWTDKARLKGLTASSKSVHMCECARVCFTASSFLQHLLFTFVMGSRPGRLSASNLNELMTLQNIFHWHFGDEICGQAICATLETSREVKAWTALSACICCAVCHIYRIDYSPFTALKQCDQLARTMLRTFACSFERSLKLSYGLLHQFPKCMF